MRGPNGPNHYDDLKRAAAGPDQSPPHVDSQATPSGPAENRDASQADGRANSPLDEVEKRIADRLAIYGVRQADNAEVVAENAARMEHDRRQAGAREVEDLAAENAKKLVEQAKTMREVHTRFDALDQNPIDLVEEKLLDRAGGRDIPNDRYHQALREQRDDNDPYGTLARAAMAEHSAFLRDQEKLEERIQSEMNVDARRSLEQRKDIEAADHIAATSRRIADQSELITGSRDTEEAVSFDERASDFEAQSDDQQARFRERTGRDATAEAQKDQSSGRDEPAPKGAETQQEAARGGVESEWKDASVEITDAKAERLARLNERFGGSDGEGAQTVAPTRPVGGGRTGL